MVELKLERITDKKEILKWMILPDELEYKFDKNEILNLLAIYTDIARKTDAVSVLTFKVNQPKANFEKTCIRFDGVKVPSLSDIGGEDVRPSFHEPLYTGGSCGIYITSDTRPDRILLGSQNLTIREKFMELDFDGYNQTITDELRKAVIGFAIRNPNMVLTDTEDISHHGLYYYYPKIKDVVNIMRKYAKYYA